MKAILALSLQDFKRLITNALFWVITVTLVLVVLVINFAIPKSIEGEEVDLYFYNMGIEMPDAKTVESEEALRAAVAEGQSIGVMKDDTGKITVIHPGLSEKTVRSVMIMLTDRGGESIGSESIYEDNRTIPFNKRMTPGFICFEALITGLIFGGALMLSEREEQTIRALRIAPMGADRYIISKILLFSLIAVLYALLMAVFTVGFDFNFGLFILLSFFGSMVFSLVGLAFSTLFKDMNSWFFSIALLLSINMLPVISYVSPSFSPVWIRMIPSYPMIFAYESILFRRAGDPLTVIVTVAAWLIIAYLLSRIMVKRFLLSKGGQRA